MCGIIYNGSFSFIICIFSYFSWQVLTISFSILIIFSKNQLLVSLIFFLFSCSLFHLFTHLYFHVSLNFGLIFFLVPWGIMCGGLRSFSKINVGTFYYKWQKLDNAYYYRICKSWLGSKYVLWLKYNHFWGLERD